MANDETLKVEDTRAETMETIKKNADEIIEKGHVPVITEKADEALAPSKNPHDYASLTRYTMHRTADGMDFRDGMRNPDWEKYTDSKKMEEARVNLFFTSNAALEAQATGQLTEAKKYATYAESILRAWFVDEDTMMTPNLEFAHMIEGEESGNFFGIIEGDDLLTFVDEATRLREAGLLSSTTEQGMSQWFEKYLQWLTTSEKGLKEKEMKNNHGTFYDTQVAKIADFLGKEDLVMETLERVKTRISSHVTELGEMPLEAERVDSYGYQLYNLYGYAKLAMVGEKYGIDLWNYEAPNGGSLKKAFEHFMVTLPDSSSKPIPEERVGQLYITLRAAAKAYKDKKYFDIPTDYFPNNKLADEITKDMFVIPE